MEKITEGIYKANLVTSISPSQVKYTRWMIPGSLGRVEPEDVAARFVDAARQHGGWVGLTVRHLGSQILNEIKEDRAFQKAKNDYVGETWKYQDRMRNRRILCIITLGIYALIKPAPIAPVKPENQELSYSPLVTFCQIQGPARLHCELRQMLSEKWLKDELAEDGQQILFPTEALIARLPVASKN